MIVSTSVMGQQVSSTVGMQPDSMATNGDKQEHPNTDGIHGISSSSCENSNRDTLNCVKTRIDMLIEGCLSKGSDNSWSSTSDASPKPVSDHLQEIKNDTVTDNKCNSDDVDDIPDDEQGKGETKSQTEPVKKDTQADVEGADSQCSLVTEVRKTNSDNNDIVEKQDNLPEPNRENSNDKEVKTTLALSELVKEITNTDSSAVCHKKSMTTFQTFIDQVLDNTLLHVNATMKNEKPTHILELCNQSMSPAVTKEHSSTDETTNKQSVEDKSIDHRKNLESKPTQRKSETQMISLKEHINRFLELSFKDCHDSSEQGSKDGNNTSNSKDIGSVPISTENFNAQGLVNNMISQGLQINKLLSPPISRSHDTQKPTRTKGDLEPGEIMSQERTFWKAGKQQFAHERSLPPGSKSHEHESRLAALMQAQPIQMDTYRHDEFKQYHRNPSGQPMSSIPPSHAYSSLPKGDHHDLRDPRFVDPRFASPQMEMSHIDTRIEVPERRPEYMTTAGPKQIPLSPIPQRPDMRLVNPSQADHMLQASMYHQPFPPRPIHSSHPGQVHKGLPGPGLGSINEHQHAADRTRPVHPRDCTCPMCALPDNRHEYRHEVRRDSDPRQDVHPFARYDTWQESKNNMHMMSSQSAIHSMNNHKSPEIHIPKPQRSPTIRPYHVSPNVALNGQLPVNDQSPAMMRPSHSVVPPEIFGYTNSPKLLPHHPPITSPKEFHNAQIAANGRVIKSPKIVQRSDSQSKYQSGVPVYPHQHQTPVVDERQRDPYLRMKEEQVLPQRVGRHDSRQDSHHDVYYARRASSPIRDYRSVNRESQTLPVSRALSRDSAFDNKSSNKSETSDAPLDLTCKRNELDHLRRPSSPGRHRSISFNGTSGTSMNMKVQNPLNTFIKHLENSVDKYCQQELKTSPQTSSPPQFIPQQPHMNISNRAITPDEFKSGNMQAYQPRSPHVPSPHRQITSPFQMQTRPHVASPHFFGQPPISQAPVSEVGSIPRQHELAPSGVASSGSQQQTQPPAVSNQNIATPPQGNFDPNNRSKGTNVSKHEPIQNIIGNHDPNDILYLICRLCAQTYGSPYGFRKHFRNQHGFEPRAEHTVVQTISATKSALHGPQVPMQIAPVQTLTPPKIEIDQPPRSERRPSSNSSNASSVSKSDYITPDNAAPVDADRDASAQKPKTATTEVSETKLLECPECHKTFQLNDFGSYKRHCRQHNQGKASGPYTCSECHLSFPEPQLLKDHCNGSHNTIFSCVTCEKTFGDMSAYMDHIHLDHEKNDQTSKLSPNDQPPKLSPQIDLHKSSNSNSPMTLPSITAVKSEACVSEHNWPDISLSVIPSQNIVKQAAESMTTMECPDSSWDDTTKVVTASCEDKVDDCVTSDSGYSSSIGSNSALVTEVEKINEKNMKSPPVDPLKQKSVDHTSPVQFSEDKNSEEFSANIYKHKKFALHRKRENSSSSQPVDITPSKQARLSPVSVTSCTTLITSTCTAMELNSEQVDSSDNSEAKVDKGFDNADCETKDLKTVHDSSPKEASVGINVKQGARHNLPFVWDRVTRSQIGRKTK